VSRRPSAVELLQQETGLLSTSHLQELGLSRRAIDAVLRATPTVILPGYTRPLIKVEDMVALIADCTYDHDRGARVAPVGGLAAKHPRLRRPHG